MNHLTALAKEFGIKTHGLQTYGGFPYSKHLNDVSDVLGRFGYTEDTPTGALLQPCSWLHDCKEDCGKTHEDLVSLFGEKIADIVECVTDEPGDNRKDRKLKTYPKTASNHLAIILKLADRIANVENSLSITKKKFLVMYKSEHTDFKQHLYTPGPAANMWKHLDSLLV